MKVNAKIYHYLVCSDNSTEIRVNEKFKENSPCKKTISTIN